MSEDYSSESLDNAIGEFRMQLDARGVGKRFTFPQPQPPSGAPVPLNAKVFGRAADNPYFPDDQPQRGGNYAQGKPLAPEIMHGEEGSFPAQLPLSQFNSAPAIALNEDNNEPPPDDSTSCFGGNGTGDATITVSGITVCPLGGSIDPNNVYILPFVGRGANYCVWQLDDGTWTVTFLLMDDGTMQLTVNLNVGPEGYFEAILGTTFGGTMTNVFDDPGGNGCADFIGGGKFGGTATASL